MSNSLVLSMRPYRVGIAGGFMADARCGTLKRALQIAKRLARQHPDRVYHVKDVTLRPSLILATFA